MARSKRRKPAVNFGAAPPHVDVNVPAALSPTGQPAKARVLKPVPDVLDAIRGKLAESREIIRPQKPTDAKGRPVQPGTEEYDDWERAMSQWEVASAALEDSPDVMLLAMIMIDVPESWKPPVTTDHQALLASYGIQPAAISYQNALERKLGWIKYAMLNGLGDAFNHAILVMTGQESDFTPGEIATGVEAAFPLAVEGQASPPGVPAYPPQSGGTG